MQGFICGEVMSFDDMKEHGNEQAVKAAGKWRQEGKTYVVQVQLGAGWGSFLGRSTAVAGVGMALQWGV